MTVFDLFRRLKPLYGKRIDQLWIEYELGDAARRREIEELLTILAIKRLGTMIGEARLVLDAPPALLISQGEFTIGSVQYPGLAPYPFRVKRNELLRHVFILGQTGTGKSTLIINFLEQFLQHGVPFIAFDFKRNYRSLLHAHRDLGVFTVGRNTAPLRINALTPPHGVPFAAWAETLSDIIGTSYLLLQGAHNVLTSALLRAHDEHGKNTTLEHALTILRVEGARTRPGSRRYAWLESATRSVEELCKLDGALSATTGTTIENLLAHAIVCELDTLAEEQRRFLCLFFLQAILLLRKASSTKREELAHVLVFDEAHNVFPREAPGTTSIPARLAREVREYGEAIISASQQTDVSDSLLANTGTKIILRCDHPKDTSYASSFLGIDAHWIPKLTLGTAIARLPVRFLTPFLFTFTPQPQKNRTTTDAFVHARWTQAGNTPARPALLHVTPREDELLRDINDHPTSTITERYARLHWHPQVGNRIKDSVIRKALAQLDAVRTRQARVKLLSLTRAGLAHLHLRGVDTTRSRHGGPEHEWWKHEIRKKLERLGYHVQEEFPLGEGRTADIRAQLENHELYIEIETGKSDIPANLAKYDGRPGRILLFFTSEKLMALAPLLLHTAEHVSLATPTTLDPVLHTLTTRETIRQRPRQVIHGSEKKEKPPRVKHSTDRRNRLPVVSLN